MSQQDAEKDALKAELKALKEWLAVLNQADPELRFRALMEKSEDGIAIVDAEGVFFYASPSTVCLMGYSPNELLGRRYLEFVHPDDRGERAAKFAECLANPRKEVRGLLRVGHRDGSWRYVECTSVNRLGEACIQGIVLNFRDVTDFLAAEAEKATSSQQKGVLVNLSALVQKAVSLDRLFSEAARSVADVLGAEYCKILELLPECNELFLRSGVGWKEGYVGHATVRNDIKYQAGYTLARTEPVLVEDLRTEARFKAPPLLQEHGVISGMSVTINARGKPFGVLGVHTVRPRLFTPKDAAFLQAVANVLATAVDEGRMEQELRENERRLRLAVDAARIGTWDWDLVLGRITWSKGNEVIFGFPIGSFQGTHQEFEQRVHPDDLDELKLHLEHALAGRGPYRHEYRVVWPDGTHHWVRGEGQAIYDEAGKAVRMLGIVMDITDRKVTENALRESEERFRDLLRNATDAIVAVDQAGKIILVSESAAKMFGYSDDEMLGKTIELLVPERLRNAHTDSRNHYQRNPVIRHMQKGGELVGQRKDGSELHLEISLTPMQMGPALSVTAFIRDISARKRAMRHAAAQHAVVLALAESASLADASPKILRSVCETIGWDVGAIWVVDELSDALRCSDVWLQPNIAAPNFLAKTRESSFRRGIGLPGRVWDNAVAAWIPDVTQDANFPRASFTEADHLHGALAFPICIHGEVLAVVEFFSKEVRQPEEDLLQLVDSIGSIMGQFLKRKQTEDLLFHAQKLEAVGSLAGGIAHEFNNLLQAISGFTRYAMEGLNTADQPYRDLQQVAAATDRAATLTRQLLSFSRREPYDAGLVNLNEIVREAETMLRPIIDQRIDITLDLADPLSCVVGDRRQLQQVILNLCINARDAMPEGGRLLIRTRSIPVAGEVRGLIGNLAPSQKIALIVADTGCGMAPGIKARMFEPFFTTKDVGQGTGLGLAIVYGIVEEHKGTIEIDSTPGLGTEFRILLPPASLADGGGVECDSSETCVELLGGDVTVLVAEDEGLLRDLICRALREAGYQLHVAKDGEEAMSLFQAHASTISIAVLDVTMPKLSGHQVAARIRAIRPSFPVVLCTGYHATNFLGTANDEATRVVSKPMEWKALLEAMQQLLVRAKAG